MKIATILPYKENYTFSKAQAAAIWVSDFFKYSKYKDQIFIYGNTKTKDYLTKNYVNIRINKLKTKFKSTTKEYCDNFIKETQKKNFDIIEIHNRPLAFNLLKNHYKSKFVLYFHNDPLSMLGSKSASERLKLLINLDKIIFISKWVQDRFFINLDKKLSDKTEVIYHSIHKVKKKYKHYAVLAARLRWIEMVLTLCHRGSAPGCRAAAPSAWVWRWSTGGVGGGTAGVGVATVRIGTASVGGAAAVN